MREFKFRVWDFRSKRLIYSNGYSRFGFIFHGKEPSTGSSLARSGEMLLLTTNPDYYEWMQFTGLKDKNGKDVYEADVIEYEAFGEKQRGQVVWSNGGFVALTKLPRAWRELQVIGNIYENPEFLS